MTETFDCSQARIALGVYVLGAIDPGERALVDAHLATCEACQAELADLADLPDMLAMVPAEEAIALAEGLPGDGSFADIPALRPLPVVPGIPKAAMPVNLELIEPGPGTEDSATRHSATDQPEEAPAQQPGIVQPDTGEPASGEAEQAEHAEQPEPLAPVADLADARRRRRRLARVAAVAAAAAIVGAASFGGVRLAASPGSGNFADQYPFGQAQGGWETGKGAAGLAVATVDYRQMGWGIQLETKVSGIPTDTPCQMWVVMRGGTRVYAASWITDNAEGHVWYPASAATSRGDVKAFVISVSGGQPIIVTPA